MRILLLLLVSWNVWAATEYLDTSCPLNGNGTAEGCASSGGGVGAWNTGASITYNAADIIYIKRGTTVTDLPTGVSSQVTLDDYGEAATACPIVSKNGTTFTLSISANDVVINDLCIRGNQSSSIISTISARTLLNRVTVYNNTTTGGIGLRFNSSSSDGACTDCTIYDIDEDGIGISATATGTFTITRLTCVGIDQGNANGDCIQAYDGTAANVTIDGGTYTKENGTKQAIRYSGSGTLWLKNAPQIYADGVDSQGVSMEGTGVLRIDSAFIRGNTGAPAIFATNTGTSYVRSTIIIGGEEGIWSSHASGTLAVENITAKDQAVAALYHTTGGTMTIKNTRLDAPINIYDASAGATTTADFNSFGDGTYRLDGATHSTLSAWKAASSQDANSTSSSPNFAGGTSPTTPAGFRLGPSSPLRSAGTNVGSLQDYGNRRFESKPSIGAWSVGSGDARATVTPR